MGGGATRDAIPETLFFLSTALFLARRVPGTALLFASLLFRTALFLAISYARGFRVLWIWRGRVSATAKALSRHNVIGQRSFNFDVEIALEREVLLIKGERALICIENDSFGEVWEACLGRCVCEVGIFESSTVISATNSEQSWLKEEFRLFDGLVYPNNVGVVRNCGLGS